MACKYGPQLQTSFWSNFSCEYSEYWSKQECSITGVDILSKIHETLPLPYDHRRKLEEYLPLNIGANKNAAAKFSMP